MLKNTQYARCFKLPLSPIGVRACCITMIALIVVIAPVAAQYQLPAFLGAESAGAFTPGGRGGQIIKVTNLNDDGAGSLRRAVSTPGPRIIVFGVSGNIFLLSRLKIDQPFVTIAGQTAPGDGIALIGNQVTIDTHDVIIRYLRFRAGDLAGTEIDALNDGSSHYNSIVDHCTASWSVDETLSFYRGRNITVQWCMITESLYNSIHSKGNHGYGGIWGGTDVSFHHNLFAHHSSRTPRFAADSSIDYRNNVIYNWGFNSAYGGERSTFNMIANYCKYGPATSGSKLYRIFQASDSQTRAYIADNYVDGSPPITADNWSGGVHYHADGSATQATLRAYTPFAAQPIAPSSAARAFDDVTAHAGASFPRRDDIDTRIIHEVHTRTAAFGSSFDGGGNGIIDSQFDLCPNGGPAAGCPECTDGDDDYCWLPVLNSAPPAPDTDDDGMPDYWEETFCLDPEDPADADTDRNDDGYTNIEEYINWLPTSAPLPVRITADLNCDRKVNLRDFAIFARAWSTSPGHPLFDRTCDFNHDDRIDPRDLSTLTHAWMPDTP
jgi:pectate lyase